MKIVFCPFRVGLFGGGLDFPDHFASKSVDVLGFAIKEGCYVSINHFPQNSNFDLRLVYKKIEETNDLDNVKHPLIRGILKLANISTCEIHYNADLPANSGLGSSSAFSNALVLGLSEYLPNKPISPKDIASTSILVERQLLAEAGGIQDQIISAYGGLTKISMKGTDWHAQKINKSSYYSFIEEHALLVSAPSRSQNKSIGIDIQSSALLDSKLLSYRRELSDISKQGLVSFFDYDIEGVAKSVNMAWELKSNLKSVSNNVLNSFGHKVIERGAMGVRLLGAGGGGYFLAVGKPENLKKLLYDPEFDCRQVKISRSGVSQMEVR